MSIEEDLRLAKEVMERDRDMLAALNDIEVTPAMLKAGALAVAEASRDDETSMPLWGDVMVLKVYYAMEMARQLEAGLTAGNNKV